MKHRLTKELQEDKSSPPRTICRGRTVAIAIVLALTFLLGSGCTKRDSVPAGQVKPEIAHPIELRDVTEVTGITFVHSDGHSGHRYIMETVTAGLALFDYNNDGLIDIYFLNGAPLRGSPTDDAATGSPPTNALYRNEGGWKFTDVTRQAGVGDQGFGLGVAAADYDNDGDLDIYVNNYGPNVLYRNEGDGTFTDVTADAAVATGNLMGAGALFLDADADGLLDLYVANYVDFTYDRHVTHGRQGFQEYAGPRDYNPVPDVLYHNNGDGTFSDISQQSGIAPHAGTGMGIVAADYDRDRDTDLFVLNDVTRNFLFVNDGSGHFAEHAMIAGAAYNTFGDALGSMGIDCGDYDNDGYLDFFMTSYQGELPVLYRNLGNGCLEDVTSTTGIGEGSFPYVNWGVGIVDFDNDGNRDAFIACGHLQDEIDQYDDSTAYEVRNILMANTGNGKFVNVSDQCGDGLAPVRSSRGAAFDDLDNDGDVDIVVLNSRRGPTLIRNDSPTRNHWIQVQLHGIQSNRDGVGAQVEVVAGPLRLVAEVHSGRGYQSHYGQRLQFGLGKQTHVDRIEVRWIGGGTDILRNVDVDQVVTILEGAAPAGKPVER